MGRCLTGLRIALALAAGYVCAASPAGAAGGVVWIDPPSQSLLTKDTVVIRGYLTEPTAQPPVAVARRPGSASILTQAPVTLSAGQLFSVTLPLVRGRNDITLGGAVLSLYHTPPLAEGQKLPADAAGFRPPSSHTPEGLACSTCHWVHQGELTLNDDMPGLCLKCHKVGTVTETLKNSLSNEHSRKITPFCVGCHDPHGTFSPKLMKREGDACTRCHTALTGRSGHEKAKPQPCATCHDPHQSPFRNLLRADPATLCGGCHREVTDTSGARSRHEPLRKEPCTRCHTHHVTDTPGLLKATDPDLCRECHKNIRLPVHERDYPRCGTCHAPHASDQLRLLSDKRPPECLKCHEDPAKSQNLHPALKEWSCMQCHNPHEDIRTLPARTLCGSCHSMGAQGFSRAHAGLPFTTVNQCLLCHQAHTGKGNAAMLSGQPHFPIRNGGCEVCHEAKEGAIALRYAGSENCVRCHGTTVGVSSAMEPEKIHAPISQQDCVACHDPHVRSRKAMLVEEPDRLCDFCHGSLVRMGPVKHKVLEKGDCLACHLPHFSDDRPLLKQPQPELCFGCHPNAAPRAPEKEENLHGALKKLRCAACHTPHTGEESKLLRKAPDALCAECHPEVLKSPKGTPWQDLHGPVGAGTCSACHYFGHMRQAKNDRFLIKNPPEKVCGECHESITDAHIPKEERLRLNRLTGGCLACHAPHGANNALMLRN